MRKISANRTRPGGCASGSEDRRIGPPEERRDAFASHLCRRSRSHNAGRGKDPTLSCAYKAKNPCCLTWLHGNKAPIDLECCVFRPRSRQGAGQFSEDLTYSDHADITVTDSRGFSPHSTCKREACANCPYSVSLIITHFRQKTNINFRNNMSKMTYNYSKNEILPPGRRPDGREIKFSRGSRSSARVCRRTRKVPWRSTSRSARQARCPWGPAPCRTGSRREPRAAPDP